jgi:hypothetical protein
MTDDQRNLSARGLANEIVVAYLSTGEPYIDEPDTCPACGGDGWYVGHEDECYDTGDCVCSGVQVRCECQERS